MPSTTFPWALSRVHHNINTCLSALRTPTPTSPAADRFASLRHPKREGHSLKRAAAARMQRRRSGVRPRSPPVAAEAAAFAAAVAAAATCPASALGSPRAEGGSAHAAARPSSAAPNPPALRGAMRILQRVRRRGTYRSQSVVDARGLSGLLLLCFV